MNHKFYTAIGLLGILLAGCLLIGFLINRIQQPVSRHLQLAMAEAQQGNWEDTGLWVTRAKNHWDTYRNFIASFSNHDPIDDIDMLFAQIQSFAAQGNTDLFLDGCVRLEQFLLSITTDHKLTWWNLLSGVFFQGLPS